MSRFFSLLLFAALTLRAIAAHSNAVSVSFSPTQLTLHKLSGGCSNSNTSHSLSSSSNAAKTATSSKKSIVRTTKVASKGKKTIADIARRRSELVKITRQKSDGKQILTVSPLSARVLRRLSSRRDGRALLLGRVETGASPVNKAKGIVRKNKASTSTAAEQKDVKNLNVVCVCELYSDDNGKSYSNLPAILELASALNQTVIGCAVGSGDGSIWGAGHVKAALQLHHLVSNASDFLVLSVFNKTPVSEMATVITVLKKRRDQKAVTLDQGLTLEAFQLSGQAWILNKNGVLDTNSCGDGLSQGDKGKGKGKGDILNLNSEVLIQSDETKAIDPVLLSVPLPVKLGRVGTVDFDHYFPTQSELREPKSGAMAKKHLLKQLGRLGSPGIKSILRDPHLLLYLSSLGVDKTSFLALCRSLREPGEALTSAVKMVLEHVKYSIDSSATAGDSDDDEDL